MKDYISIGSSPYGENCAQVGNDDYYKRSHKEMKVLINLLRRINGKEPKGAFLIIKSFPHDFGTYYEVVCVYDDDDEEATKYAHNCEKNLPEWWDKKARIELNL